MDMSDVVSKSDTPEIHSVRFNDEYLLCSTTTYITQKDFTAAKDYDKTCLLNSVPVEHISMLVVNQRRGALEKRTHLQLV